MIYEIFRCCTGATQGYREGKHLARQACERSLAVLDYRTAPEGFYVVGNCGYVYGGPHDTFEAANRAAEALNAESPFNTYDVSRQFAQEVEQ